MVPVAQYRRCHQATPEIAAGSTERMTINRLLNSIIYSEQFICVHLKITHKSPTNLLDGKRRRRRRRQEEGLLLDNGERRQRRLRQQEELLLAGRCKNELLRLGRGDWDEGLGRWEEDGAGRSWPCSAAQKKESTLSRW